MSVISNVLIHVLELTRLQNDCIQWVIENSPKSRPWSVTRVVHELMALWFGSVHITATVRKLNLSSVPKLTPRLIIWLDCMLRIV